MSTHEPGAIINPMMYGWQAVPSDSIGLLHKTASLPTSQELLGVNPMLDEWVLLARALINVMTITQS